MLRRVMAPERASATGATAPYVTAAEAGFPQPVPGGLEFNAPVHESWNIVHTGMLVPECHQVYVGTGNCLRGVALTAAEMGACDRYSSVTVEERDLVVDNLESVTVEGVTDVLRRLLQLPRAVMVFLVCLHHFTGTDVGHVYRELGRRFPDVCFLRCWMDPIMRKTGLTPEQRQRSAMLDPLEDLPQDPRQVAVVGDDLRLPAQSDLACLLMGGGYHLRQTQDCATFDEYRALGASTAFVTRSPLAVRGVRRCAERLGRGWLYLPPSLSYDAIDAGLAQVAGLLGLDVPATIDQRLACDAVLEGLRDELGAGAVPIAIDHLAVNHPLELARLLVEHGLGVGRVYVDVVGEEERGSLAWLARHAPTLELWSTTHPALRSLPRDGGGRRWLAVGPKAAWFCGTDRFVNIIETDGSWGYAAILHLVDLMREAWRTPKDVRAIVPRKGLGCACACQLPGQGREP